MSNPRDPQTNRRHYVVAYDIADDKRRTRVFDTLHDFGDHVQYSVFLCQLNRRELAELTGRLTEAIHHREDQVMFIDFGPAHSDCETLIQTIGRGYNPVNNTIVV